MHAHCDYLFDYFYCIIIYLLQSVQTMQQVHYIINGLMNHGFTATLNVTNTQYFHNSIINYSIYVLEMISLKR